MVTAALAAPAARGRRRWRRVSQVVLGLGALGLVGSSAVYLASPADDRTMPTYNDRKAPAADVFVGSSFVMGAGLYLYLRESRSISDATAAMLGAGAAALLASAMWYAADEDLYQGPGWQREYYYDSAIHGLIAGSAGVALTGVGIWLLTRDLRGHVGADRIHGTRQRIHGLGRPFLALDFARRRWMRDGRKHMGSIGSGSGVPARSGPGLAPGKRTLTEDLQPSRRTGGESYAPGPDGTWFGSLGVGAIRPPVVGDVDTQCVGEAFARDLSDEALEQTIEYLIQRRDRPTSPARSRGRDREPRRARSRVRPAGAIERRARPRRRADADPRRHRRRAGARRDPAAALREPGRPPQPSGHRAVPRAGRRSPHLGGRHRERGISYMELATSTGGQAGIALLGMAATRAQAARGRARDPSSVVRVPSATRPRRDAAAVAARVPLSCARP